MEDLLTREKSDVKAPRPYNVVMFNDDYTVVDFVVYILIQIFGKTTDEAIALAQEVHENGRGIAGTYPRDIAETKVAQAMDKAKEYEFPFRMEAQPS